ncbi:MAG TPA: prepilin-type N-terminal cleavage/methylation domain-containing protein [Candidatus Angelobacter sp.]|jgi:prepilin-type N-terminal cleavage/methylation domain-containing protein|nr:prepilin-type N-terminal cleavage/methylation domain-containing protein [Candidatus Angelobacter sp.]
MNKHSCKQSSGFSLLELMIALAVFMVIGGAAVSVMSTHASLANSEQNQVGLNIALRNAATQMQLDVVNAGTGYYQGVNIPAWPIGITVLNNPTNTNCYNAATHTYGPTCFDTLNVITTNNTIPPAHPQDSGANCVSTTSSSLFVTPSDATPLATLAADFHSGDQVLLVKSDGSQMATVVLTSDGQVTGGKVKLAHNPTGADGTTSDPLGIANTADSNKLGTQFCTSDWVLKLSAITYSVDATDPTDPKLMRTQNGTANVIAEQVIGFKVGASIWNGNNDNPYSFDATSYNHDWSLIRSVRVSIIGRGNYIKDVNNKFTNTFDQGNYRVQGISVIISPRNLSMNDI